MIADFYRRLEGELAQLEKESLKKLERVIISSQAARVIVDSEDGPHALINFCANNYLGLASDARVIEASITATRRWGAGLASVRFICGTQEIHKTLERKVADYLGYEDAILFAAAFDANGAVFEPLLGPEDAIISDMLNHASLIDGIRLSKAKRYRYASNDMNALEQVLAEARKDGARTILIATDGVFSMDGTIANLPDLVALARKYDALTLVDDCHATGFLGAGGCGTAAHYGLVGQIDIVTGTFGKALGGAMGGFVAARSSVVELLRQRGRPYLFSNALAPAICGAALKAIELAQGPEGDAMRERLFANAEAFRSGLTVLGYDLLPGRHPIIPVMLYDASKAKALADALYRQGIYVTAFSFPVVPRGQARIRTQMSAAHSPEQIETTIRAFEVAGKALRII